jgi:hypothetical protein
MFVLNKSTPRLCESGESEGETPPDKKKPTASKARPLYDRSVLKTSTRQIYTSSDDDESMAMSDMNKNSAMYDKSNLKKLNRNLASKDKESSIPSASATIATATVKLSSKHRLGSWAPTKMKQPSSHQA